MSNKNRWKKHKFSQIKYLSLDYNPVVIQEVEKGAVFLGDEFKSLPSLDEEQSNTVDLIPTQTLDDQFNIRGLLFKTFIKRNIAFKDGAAFELSIDSIKFKGYSESVSVMMNDCSTEYDDEDHFQFYLYASLKQDGETLFNISESIHHNTSPRESFLIPGFMVYDGILAEPKIMIENTVHRFSYSLYRKLKELQLDISSIEVTE